MSLLKMERTAHQPGGRKERWQCGMASRGLYLRQRARDNFNEVDAAKNASTLCRIICQDAEWGMMRDNAHLSILQPMRQSVELLKVVSSAFKQQGTAWLRRLRMIRSRCYGSLIPESVSALK